MQKNKPMKSYDVYLVPKSKNLPDGNVLYAVIIDGELVEFAARDNAPRTLKHIIFENTPEYPAPSEIVQSLIREAECGSNTLIFSVGERLYSLGGLPKRLYADTAELVSGNLRSCILNCFPSDFSNILAPLMCKSLSKLGISRILPHVKDLGLRDAICEHLCHK